MTHPLDSLMDLIDMSRDWTKAAMCADSGVDMVPGPEGDHATMGEEVMLAKKICMMCLVKDVCLADALGDGTEPGEPGVYGALTLDERERLRIRRILSPEAGVVSCSHCGQDCVPLVEDGTECDSCYVVDGKARSPELFKSNIIALVTAGHPYKAIAEHYKLKTDAVSKAVRRWGYRSLPGPRHIGPSGRIDLAPCGTPAAIRRHQRRNEPMKDCLCARPGAWNPNKKRSNGWSAAAA